MPIVGLALLSTAYCRGCEDPVYVYRDEASGREVVRDGAFWGMPGPRHVCTDSRVRERIELRPENMLARCEECGATDVAVTTWGRLVECPWPSWASLLWDEQYEPHVCLRRRADARPAPRQPSATRKQPLAVVAGLSVPEL